MGEIRFGPSSVPSRERPEAAVELLLERGYSACEIDFASGFWMEYPWAERFGALADDAGIALSVHAPIAGFMGHVELGKKYRMAVGMLDHSAGGWRQRAVPCRSGSRSWAASASSAAPRTCSRPRLACSGCGRCWTSRT